MEEPASIELSGGPIIVAIQGHGSSGKINLAREIARSLGLHGYRCSLFSYDDVRASILRTLGSSSSIDHGLFDDVAHRILCRIASSHLSRSHRVNRLAVVLDSPFSSRVHLDQVLNLVGATPRKPFFLVVKCQSTDEATWQQRSESRVDSAASAAIDESSPSPCEQIQRESSVQRECCTDGFLGLTVYTTDSTRLARDHAVEVIRHMSLCTQKPVEPEPDLTIEAARSSEQSSRRHFSHHHLLFSYRWHDIGRNDEETTSICTICREALSGPVYGCSRCRFFLHESCAELPQTIKFGRTEFILGPTHGEEIVQPGQCLVCDGQSGVLYSFDAPLYDVGLKCWIHQNCAGLPYKLKHSCHEHLLQLTISSLVFTCGACGTYGLYAAYYCEACDVCFHLMCTLYLEARVVHERHRHHSFILSTIPRDEIDEDEIDEYYCEICAEQRHPDLWAYYCKICKYEAHISCVNPMINPCNPDVLLPENRAEGKLSQIKKYPWDFPEVRNPVLSEISGSQVAWEPVDEDEPD